MRRLLVLSPILLAACAPTHQLKEHQDEIWNLVSTTDNAIKWVRVSDIKSHGSEKMVWSVFAMDVKDGGVDSQVSYESVNCNTNEICQLNRTYYMKGQAVHNTDERKCFKVKSGTFLDHYKDAVCKGNFDEEYSYSLPSVDYVIDMSQHAWKQRK